MEDPILDQGTDPEGVHDPEGSPDWSGSLLGGLQPMERVHAS